jgi:NAD(P)-dependent dehydrogenase (short-subunit alcohol dehydrogenase family)
MDLQGRVVLVTGAGRGLGRSIVLEAAKAGATVVGGSRTTADLDSLEADVSARGGKFARTRLDVTISHAFADVPAQEVRDMLGGTAARVFGFALGRLQQLADRIGPTVEDVRTPPAKLPSVPDESMSPVFL